MRCLISYRGASAIKNYINSTAGIVHSVGSGDSSVYDCRKIEKKEKEYE